METKEDCPFRTPEELGLTSRERDALIKTLLLMENGQVKHVPYGSKLDDPEAAEGKLPFNMNTWHEKWGCGTTCCIGGTAEIVGGLGWGQLQDTSDRLAYLEGRPELSKLFFRWGGDDPTEQRAAQVLRGYLTTGITRW